MRRRRKFTICAPLIGAALGLVFSESASATISTYKPAAPAMAALTAYGSGMGYITHLGNQMNSCQNPTFAAAIYLMTTGGSQIRRVDGNCALANNHSSNPEASTIAVCANKATTSKFAQCQEWI